jgi:hypothetical protein
MRRIAFTFLFILASIEPGFAQGIMTSIPEEIDAGAKWVFYLPDEIVTPAQPEPRHPQFGVYKYFDIVNRFVAAGFKVVSRPRESTEHPYVVAEEIAAQIRKLLAAGVPAGSVGIVGAGKGAAITVIVTDTVDAPDLQVVLLSACTAPFITFWRQHEELLAGNVLSIYAIGDEKKGPCLPFLEYCSAHLVKEYREIPLPEKAGPGFYYKGTADWMLPAIAWLRGQHDVVGEQGLLPPEVHKPER